MNLNISVIIPTYNREKTIERCIYSILNQTYLPYEIIVVDDGSTDNTIEIVKKIDRKHIKIIEQKHKGAQAARNTGIRMAQGEYIAFLDSDDEWLPEKLELQVEELKKNKSAVICGRGYLQIDWEKGIPKVYETTHKMSYVYHSKKVMKLNGKSGKVYKEILNNSFCLFQVLMTSKKNLIEIGLLDESVPAYQEWDTAIRLAKNNEFIFIQKPLFIYHLHDGETISKSTKKAIDGMEYNCKKFQYEILSQLGSRALTQRYYDLLRQCKKYKDKRFFVYLLKYCMGKLNIFWLK